MEKVTAGELTGMGNWVMVQVAAYNTEGQTFGGKKIYFINETVDSKNVEIN